MIKLSKFVVAAIVVIAMCGPDTASADPITDLFDGVFHQTRNQPVANNGRRGHHSVTAEPADNNWVATTSSHSGSRMVASYYGHGERLSRHTASGQRFNPHAMTAAHRTYPFGTRLHVCHRGCVTVVVNDRGPFVRGRHLDLSYGAARAIGMTSTSTITVQRLD